MFDSEKDKTILNAMHEKHPIMYFIGDLFINIVLIVLLVYVVRTFIISPFQVYGPSMCNNLNYINETCQDAFGEYLIVNKATYYPFFGRRFSTPQRGDIVVFKPPHNPNDFYIKRIIGLPGEKVKIQNGKVFVFNKEHQSGFELPEDYLSSENRGQTYPVSTQKVTSYVVPKDAYFVLGDNRKKSTDSRTCFRGLLDDCSDPNSYFLDINKIEGKAWIVLWPFNKMRLLHNPAYGI